MNAVSLVLHAWSWDPLVLALCAAAALAYGAVFRSAARWGWFSAATAVVLFTLLSPLNALAAGVLFSAHMAQHILLLLIAPGLFLLSLPRDFGSRPRAGDSPPAARRWLVLLGWAGGVGSMWLWHVPELCDAATSDPVVHGLQTVSLLVLGTTFWWPVFAPSIRDRLHPGHAVAYLATACLACTALGIILTLTPIEVCPVFRAPSTLSPPWAALRDSVDADRDRQIGGLLMWVPMCLVYLGAIVLELFRWFGGDEEAVRARRGEVRP